MNILLMCNAYNSLTQHTHIELRQSGHQVSVAVTPNAAAMVDAVAQIRPELIVCPMLTHFIPREVWENTRCLILHPGITGDRGVSALDWAILNNEEVWGVTVVEADDLADAGAIWGNARFAMRAASKSSLYRDEVSFAALRALKVAVRRFVGGSFIPEPLNYLNPSVRGRFRAQVKQAQRQIDWGIDSAATILRKIRSSDSQPGLLDHLYGEPVYLYGAHAEGSFIGEPGAVIGRRHGAILRACVDGAIWISHVKRKAPDQFKLPAEMVFGERLANVPQLDVELVRQQRDMSYREIWYEEHGDIGHVNFRFYNGAMSTGQCQRLRDAIEYAKTRPTRVIVLSGGRDFFSNGIHLNVIEAAADPAAESWENINAMNDAVLSILTAERHLTIAALYGSAGAGGVMLALAADRVLAREAIVLNPHYRSMGGLYGSEYWTYTLPRRVGAEQAERLTRSCPPVGVEEANRLGLIDDIVIRDALGSDGLASFREQIERIARQAAAAPDFAAQLAAKAARRVRDEQEKPLAQYRAEELEHMKRNFWGEDRAYHEARRNFVLKRGHSRLIRAEE